MKVVQVVLFCAIWSAWLSVSASNASYIAISNDLAQQAQLDVTANNAANTNTVGYEQDDVIYKVRNHKESKRKTDSFVVPKGNYRGSAKGGLKTTGRNLDLAILGDGYFKILTPRGPRYTLAGNFLIDNQRVIVNADGFPVASQVGQPIVVPAPQDFLLLDVAKDGTVYADLDQIDIIGVFGFQGVPNLAKEAGNLYAASTPDVALDNTQAIIQSGALRTSNVNSAKVLTTMIELQRSSEASQRLVTDIANLERGTITKVMK